MLNEISQTQKEKICDFSYMWNNIKKKTSETENKTMLIRSVGEEGGKLEGTVPRINGSCVGWAGVAIKCIA